MCRSSVLRMLYNAGAFDAGCIVSVGRRVQRTKVREGSKDRMVQRTKDRMVQRTTDWEVERTKYREGLKDKGPGGFKGQRTGRVQNTKDREGSKDRRVQSLLCLMVQFRVIVAQ